MRKMAASMDRENDTVIVVLTENAQKMRHYLEVDGFWDSRRRLQRLNRNVIAIPVSGSVSSAIERETLKEAELFEYHSKILASGRYHDLPCHLVSVYLPTSKKQLAVSPHQRLVNALRAKFEELDIPFPEEVQEEIPDGWEKHEDLILLPRSSLCSFKWERCPNLWQEVATALGGQRVARKGRVRQDEFRSPRVELLLGNHGWVEHRDNGLRYTYDVRHCMFSIGNITEKIRVAGLHCKGETVVDLYAGIGYFTLPYLVHAKASLVHACEWNPNAVTALKKNLALNGVQDRCIVHEGDNREVCPRGVADRVNLGLIPSSEVGWPVACAALKPSSGGVLHVHGNVTSPAKTRTTGSVSLGVQAIDLAAKEGGTSPCTSGTRTASVVSPPLAGIRTADPGCPAEDVSSGNPHQKGAIGDRIGPCVLLPDLNAGNSDSGFTIDSAGCSFGDSVELAEPNAAGHEELMDQLHQLRKDVKCPADYWESEKTFTNRSRVDSESGRKDYWSSWARATARKIQELLVDIQGSRWTTHVMHIEHVKSYAPRVDHIVADIRCLPVAHSSDEV
ncbi:tRNA wybutosine-synthesizing protein 2 homolog [Acanthaster planci]|uniref:tRNA(Phe) (4-demethylwyosine(37)-C(7)) aminocarboxypropyltransferase n=1 Tax=Acanthaster planci TaxID=133434 RepID=A0A8B7YT93_ACAPL|nr:tRNA wybutosine-synthesizing protein 2 homolog [Acanthaster planci]